MRTRILNKANLKNHTIFSTYNKCFSTLRYPGNLLKSIQGDMDLYGEKISGDFQKVIDCFEKGDIQSAGQMIVRIYNEIANRPFQEPEYAQTKTGFGHHSTIMIKLHRAKELLEVAQECSPVSHKA